LLLIPSSVLACLPARVRVFALSYFQSEGYSFYGWIEKGEDEEEEKRKLELISYEGAKGL